MLLTLTVNLAVDYNKYSCWQPLADHEAIWMDSRVRKRAYEALYAALKAVLAESAMKPEGMWRVIMVYHSHRIAQLCREELEDSCLSGTSVGNY